MKENPSKSAKHSNNSPKNRNDNAGDNIETRILPESIVMDEILPRLPVKSLIRFQTVSKYWLATISKDPDFVKLHFKFSSLFRRHFLIYKLTWDMYVKSNDFFLLPYRKCSSEDDLVRLLGYDFGEDSCDFLGTCNGLVCLYHRHEEDIMQLDWDRYINICFEVWNPATCQRNVIDSPPGVVYSFAYGFGYVSSLDDYKIVCSFATYYEGDFEGEDMFRGFYVFSLRSGEWEKKFGGYDYSSGDRQWRRVKDYSDEDRRKKEIVMKLRRQGFWNEGILYWPPSKWPPRIYITGFDLTTEEFKEYTSMDWQRDYDIVNLFKLKQCLALHGHKLNDRVSDFWVLKDSDDWGSWQLMFSVCDIGVLLTTISETGMCLIRHLQIFKLVDLSKEALESVDGHGLVANEVKAIDYVESLVSPFGMPKNKEEEKSKDIVIVDKMSGSFVLVCLRYHLYTHAIPDKCFFQAEVFVCRKMAFSSKIILEEVNI